MKPWRLTRHAEQRLTEIAEWTAKRFGHKQALAYQDALIDRIKALASGDPPPARPCEVLMQGLPAARGLLYCHEGSHYIILRETDKELDVLDFLHERSDLPRHIANLEGR